MLNVREERDARAVMDADPAVRAGGWSTSSERCDPCSTRPGTYAPTAPSPLAWGRGVDDCLEHHPVVLDRGLVVEGHAEPAHHRKAANIRPVGDRDDPGHAQGVEGVVQPGAGGTAMEAPDSRARTGYTTLGAACFLVAALAVALGITVVVASGFGKMVSFEHIFPTLVDKG